MTLTDVMPELTMFDRAKSMSRYLPAYGTDAIVRLRVSSGMFLSCRFEKIIP